MESSNAEESFLTVAEVAELLKLNQQTVRNWIDQGILPALRVGRRVRIRRSDFERVIAEAELKRATAQYGGPSAEDFWGGEPVGIAEPVDTDELVEPVAASASSQDPVAEMSPTSAPSSASGATSPPTNPHNSPMPP